MANVHQTFEEFAGRHIDGLYHGALFLNAGEESRAEDLVLWTLTGAFQEFRGVESGGAGERWIEGRLVETFLARSGVDTEDLLEEDGSLEALEDDPRSSHRPSTGTVEIDHEVLFRSGADMPPLARAAIWLVLFRRWPYAEASNVLKTNVDGIKGLLQYRRVLLTAVVRGSVDRNGTDLDRRN